MYGLHLLTPTKYIMLIISNNHREGNLVKVLTIRVSKLKKLRNDKLQSKV